VANTVYVVTICLIRVSWYFIFKVVGSYAQAFSENEKFQKFSYVNGKKYTSQA
jgi:hypothetical protein